MTTTYNPANYSTKIGAVIINIFDLLEKGEAIENLDIERQAKQEQIKTLKAKSFKDSDNKPISMSSIFIAIFSKIETAEKFVSVWDETKAAWKAAGHTILPAYIVQYASNLKATLKAGLKLSEYKSVEAAVRAARIKNKADKVMEDAAKESADIPDSFQSTVVELAKVVKELDTDNQQRMVAELMAIGGKYAEILKAAVGDTSPTKAATPKKKTVKTGNKAA